MELLKNPDLVSTNGYTAFASALWFYMTPQTPKPSMHEIATELYVPNSDDQSRGLGPYFGSSTMVINGGLECSSGTESQASLNRISYF